MNTLHELTAEQQIIENLKMYNSKGVNIWCTLDNIKNLFQARQALIKLIEQKIIDVEFFAIPNVKALFPLYSYKPRPKPILRIVC